MAGRATGYTNFFKKATGEAAADPNEDNEIEDYTSIKKEVPGSTVAERRKAALKRRLQQRKAMQ